MKTLEREVPAWPWGEYKYAVAQRIRELIGSRNEADGGLHVAGQAPGPQRGPLQNHASCMSHSNAVPR